MMRGSCGNITKNRPWPPARRLSTAQRFAGLRSLHHEVGDFSRYSRQELSAELQQAGFEIEHSPYMNLLSTFGWVCNNRIICRKEESLRQVLFFDRAIVPWLPKIEKRVHPPFGLSLVTISRQPHGA